MPIIKESEKEQVTEAIVPVSQVQLGSLSVRNPADLVTKATEMADALAAIIVKQNLFKVINGRKYVMVEGWTTLGAMMGIVPVEEFCRPLALDSEGLVTGFEAKVKLIRAGDGGTVGAASAECTYEESNWRDRNSYAVRSMSITRATGKAYRLSFSWIMKLAGFEPTPAEEMTGEGQTGRREAAQEVARRKIAEAKAKRPANATGSPRTNAKAEVDPNPKGKHESLTLSHYKGKIALSGPGLSIIRAEMRNYDKEYFGIALVDKGVFCLPDEKLVFKFQDLCTRLGVNAEWADDGERNPTLPRAVIPPADIFPDQPEAESTDPILLDAKMIENPGKKAFMQLNWDGGKHSSFDKGLWPILLTAKGKPVMLETKANGKYSNLVRIVRVDGVSFADERNQGPDEMIPF